MSRRRGSHLKPATIVKGIVVCTFLCLAGIGYVWAKTELYALNKEIKTRENRLEELRRENGALERKYAGLCTPKALNDKVRELSLGLGRPPLDQIIRVEEPGAGMGSPITAAAPGRIPEISRVAQGSGGVTGAYARAE